MHRATTRGGSYTKYKAHGVKCLSDHLTSGLAFAVHIKECQTDKASSASKLKYGDRKVLLLGL